MLTQTEFLQPLKSMKGNTVYVIYSQSEKKDSKGIPLINCRIAQEGWSYGQTAWEFSGRKYDSPNAHQVKIQQQVDNTQGFVSDEICLTDYRPIF